MSEPRRPLAHITVLGRAEDQGLHRQGRGNARVREVERRAHGGKLRGDLQNAFTAAEADRETVDEQLTLDELKALGVILVLDAAEPAFPLHLDSLERLSRQRTTEKRPQWLLLSVTPGSDNQPESAVVWVADEYRAQFLKLFEDFLQRQTPKGHPRNRQLVANIAQIRRGVLRDLWQSDDEPPVRGVHWWELWLTRTDTAVDLLLTYATASGLRVSPRRMELTNRIVVWVHAHWSNLEGLPFTAVPVAELRRPEFVDTVEDLSRDEQDDWATDLVDRTTAAGCSPPFSLTT